MTPKISIERGISSSFYGELIMMDTQKCLKNIFIRTSCKNIFAKFLVILKQFKPEKLLNKKY